MRSSSELATSACVSGAAVIEARVLISPVDEQAARRERIGRAGRIAFGTVDGGKCDAAHRPAGADFRKGCGRAATGLRLCRFGKAAERHDDERRCTDDPSHRRLLVQSAVCGPCVLLIQTRHREKANSTSPRDASRIDTAITRAARILTAMRRYLIATLTLLIPCALHRTPSRRRHVSAAAGRGRRPLRFPPHADRRQQRDRRREHGDDAGDRGGREGTRARPGEGCGRQGDDGVVGDVRWGECHVRPRGRPPAHHAGDASSGRNRRLLHHDYRGVPAGGLRIINNIHGERTAFSENWPNNARHWLPMVDHPYDKATGEFIVTAPAQYQVVANGLLQEEVDLPNGMRRTHWKQSVPIASWLYALGVARFSARHYATSKGNPAAGLGFSAGCRDWPARIRLHRPPRL